MEASPAVPGRPSPAEVSGVGKVAAAAGMEVTTAMEVAAATSSVAATMSPAMTAAAAPRKCAARKGDREHGNCQDKPGHRHPPADFSAKEETFDGTESSLRAT
jgi:hypothetical protein